MDEEVEKEEPKKETPILLSLVAIVFIIRGLYWGLTIMQYVTPADWRVGDFLVIGFTILISGIYLLVPIGIHLRRRFAYYIGLFSVVVELILGIFTISMSPVSVLVGIIFAVILLWILLNNSSYFKEADKADKQVIKGLIVYFILLVVIAFGSNYLPSDKEYAAIVTQEAVDKGDGRVCERLDRGYRSDCIIEVAKQKHDLSLCTKLSGTSKDDCYYSLAVALHNSTICEKIDNVYERSRCPGSVS